MTRIYISDACDDRNDGLTRETAIYSWQRAVKLCDGNTDTNLIQRDATLERLAGEIAKRRAVGARQDPTTAPEDLRNLLRPYDESLMEAYAGSCLVNIRMTRKNASNRSRTFNEPASERSSGGNLKNPRQGKPIEVRRVSSVWMPSARRTEVTTFTSCGNLIGSPVGGHGFEN